MHHCSYQHDDVNAGSSNVQNGTHESSCCCPELNCYSCCCCNYDNYYEDFCNDSYDNFYCDNCIEKSTDKLCGQCSEHTRENISTIIIYIVLMTFYILFIYVIIKIVHFVYKSSYIWTFKHL